MKTAAPSTIDRIKAMGLKPDAMLHVTMLCNSVRLAADAIELREAEAQAQGFAAGLLAGGGISTDQKEQLAGLFDELAAVAIAQHSRSMPLTDACTSELNTEPDFDLENLAFERAAAELSFPLEKRQGGTYLSEPTQRAWALWIHRAAIEGVKVLADRKNLNLYGLEKSIEEQLADTIRDLARQDCPEFRGQYYGECRGLLKALRLGDLLDETQRDQWSADIYRASLQAAEQCVAAGKPSDEAAVNQQRFQLELLAERSITPRTELPR